MYSLISTTKYLALFLTLGLISACVSPSHKESENASLSSQEISEYQLVESENIQNLLIANIAFHRLEDKLALDALSQVAVQSRNVRLLEDTILLAHQLNDEATMKRLNKVLIETDPDNDYALLNLANQALNSGEVRIGSDYLLRYLTHIDETTPRQIRNVSSLILKKDRATQESIVYDLTHTKNINTYLTAAIVYDFNQRLDLHQKWLDKALQLKPELEYAAVLKLNLLIKNEQELNVIRDFATSHLKQQPNQIQFHMLYISHLIEQQQYKTAIKALNKVLTQEPKHRSAHYIIGLTYLELQKRDKAISSFQTALKIDPQNDQARFYLAEAYELDNNHEKSIATLNSITSDSNYFDAQTQIGLSIAKHESVEEGIEYLKQIDTHSNYEKIQLILLQERLLRQNEKWDEIIQLLNDALSRFPDDTEIRYSRGFAYSMLNNIEMHERDMRRVLDTDPANAQALNALGYTLADKTTRYQEALELIQQANELSPGSPYILDSLGWVYYRLKQNETALKYLLEAYEIMPDAEIAAHIGEVYWQTGQTKKAEHYWQLGRKLDPDNKTLQETLIRLLAND